MEPTDIALMLRVQQDDVAAFGLLAQRYRAALRRYFVALLPDSSFADDFAQETLLRLWLSRERYQPTGKFAAYLFQIGRHYWLNQRESLRRDVSEKHGDLREAAGRESGSPEWVIWERLRNARLRNAIDALPPHYRAVFEMCHFEGLKYTEIACRLGIPIGTVKSRMAEAVRRLRGALTGEEGEE